MISISIGSGIIKIGIYTYLTDIFFPPEVKDICSTSDECRTSPLTQFSQSSLPLHRQSYILSNFCTEHNVQECLLHINQVGNLTPTKCLCLVV